jgi:hypothetical protein
MIFCARATRGLRRPSLDAVEDQSAPIPEEITSELGGIICNLARRPHVTNMGALPRKKKQASLEGSIRWMMIARCAYVRIDWDNSEK